MSLRFPDEIDDVADEVVAELRRALDLHPAPQSSAHEGFAVLAEEVDELWDAVKMRQSDTQRLSMIRKEAIQVAAMAIRLIMQVCDRGVIR